MKNNDLKKLYLMIITLPKGKKEIMGDVLETYDVTAYLSTLARGTLHPHLEKELMMFIIKEDMIKDAMLKIEDKFNKFHTTDLSMVYTIPLFSIIGVSSYIMLSNGGKK